MRFRNEKATGQVTLAPLMRHKRGCPEHELCKLNVLRHLTDRLALDPSRVLVVGDSANDICLLKAAGTSVAFQPKSPATAAAAQHVVNDSLARVLDLL